MTEPCTPDWRRIADNRLGQLAAIARIGAEPPEAVLAIIQDADPDPDAGTNDTSTIYHESVDDFRRGLVKTAQWHHKVCEPYSKRVYATRKTAADPRPVVPDEIRDAHAGNLMAGSYAYVLAAVLGEAEKRLGPQSARMLANIADDILANGDDGDDGGLNADVNPGTPLPPPTPAEQMQAGQLSVFDTIPGDAASTAA